jgi:hypothetical protein
MASTLGFTGMDSATEAALTAAFQQANADLGSTWQLRPEADAEHVIVDMDSMYGPMSWLRLHAAGKQVIGLTSAQRTQTDFHLARPFEAASVAALLKAVQQGAGAKAAEPATPSRPAAPAAKPAGMSPSPVPQDQLPEEHPQPVDEEAEAPAPFPGLAASVEAGTLAPATIAPAPVSSPPPPPRERGLADWLAPGMLSGHLRFRPSSGQPIFIDATARQYFATPSLKPLASAVEGTVARDDFEPVDGATWTRETGTLGAPQPLNRLQWFAGLVAGKGELMSEFDPAGRYKLGKWPQTEREFPKHFRIATAMMKGPATLDEIAAASGVPLADVVDFVNASLVTGYAEAVREAPAESAEPAKPGGLLGRLRGK